MRSISYIICKHSRVMALGNHIMYKDSKATTSISYIICKHSYAMAICNNIIYKDSKATRSMSYILSKDSHAMALGNRQGLLHKHMTFHRLYVFLKLIWTRAAPNIASASRLHLPASSGQTNRAKQQSRNHLMNKKMQYH